LGQQTNRILWKTQNKGYYAIQGHQGRKPVCDFLLVINSDWHIILYHCRVITAYCSNSGHFTFLSYPLGGLGTMYDVHLWLIGKCVVDFLLALIDFFHYILWLRRYGWNMLKIGDFAPPRSVWPKISGRRGCPHELFLHGWLGQWMPYYFAANSFHTKKLCSRLSSSYFTGKMAVLHFEPLFGDLGATYNDHLRLIGKHVLAVSVKWTFFTRCYGWGTTSEYLFKIGDFAPMGAGWPKISGRRGRPHQSFFFSEN